MYFLFECKLSAVRSIAGVLADLDPPVQIRWRIWTPRSISARINLKKGMFCGGSKSAKGGPNPLADMDRGSKSAGRFGLGVPNSRGVQIRCDTGFQCRIIIKTIQQINSRIKEAKVDEY